MYLTKSSFLSKKDKEIFVILKTQKKNSFEQRNAQRS